MLETYAELVAYFEAMPTHVTALKGATVGDDEAILNMEASQIVYPHLWVETPAVRFTGLGDTPAKVFDLSMTVLLNEADKTNPAANAALSTALGIMERVYAQIFADEADGLFCVALRDEELEPIRRWSGDNGHGWRGGISIEMPRCECEDC